MPNGCFRVPWFICCIFGKAAGLCFLAEQLIALKGEDEQQPRQRKVRRQANVFSCVHCVLSEIRLFHDVRRFQIFRRFLIPREKSSGNLARGFSANLKIRPLQSRAYKSTSFICINVRVLYETFSEELRSP